MSRLTDEAVELITKETTAVAETVARKRVDEFLVAEAKRRSILAAIFAGANIAVIAGVLLTMYLAGKTTVQETAREFTKQVVETESVKGIVKGITEAANEAHREVASLQARTGEGLAQSERAKKQAESAVSELKARIDEVAQERSKAAGYVTQLEQASASISVQLKQINELAALSESLSTSDEWNKSRIDELQKGLEQYIDRQIASERARITTAAQALPIGTIIAWHQHFPGTPELPDGWLPCNGQQISDAPSPYLGAVLPNLNSERLFLRGGATSGVVEGHATAMPNMPFTVEGSGDHVHRVPRTGPRGAVSLTVEGGGSSYDQGPIETTPSGPHSHPLVGGDVETRPKNMSVIWIMRVR